jgi:hypothetical protein
MKNDTPDTTIRVWISWIVVVVISRFATAFLGYRLRQIFGPDGLPIERFGVLAIITLVLFVVNYIKQKATTWQLAFLSALPAVGSYFLCIGI